MIIGGITLDNDLIWEDEFKFTQGTGVATETIYGNTFVQTFATTHAQPLTLSGDGGFGWQKRSTVIALKALAEGDPGVIHAVTLPDNRVVYASFRVDERPAVDFTPVAKATAPTGDFWYYGTVKMRIVTG